MRIVSGAVMRLSREGAHRLQTTGRSYPSLDYGAGKWTRRHSTEIELIRQMAFFFSRAGPKPCRYAPRL